MKIGTKYLLAFSVSIVLFLVAGFVIFNQVQNVQSDIEALERRGDRSIDITEMGSLIRTKDIRVADYVNFESKELIKQFEERREKFNELEAQIRPKMDTDEQKKLYDRIVLNDKKMNDLFMNELVPSVDENGASGATVIRNQIGAIRTETVNLLQDLKGIVNEERQLAIQQAKDSLAQSILTLLISIVAAAVVGTILIMVVNRMIQKNLRKVVHMSNEISNGNLQVESIDYDGKDEVGQLASSINEMKDSLRSVIQQVSTASESVSSQSEELTQSSHEVKEGSEQVASTMQELASGAESQATHSTTLSEKMEGFLGKIQLAHDSGEQVSKASNEVLTMTDEGSALMKQSVEQMSTIDEIVKDAVKKVEGLDEQSKEISKLIQVINDIAEQTNLLSLNAAIEAARAGEHGKGFAVVADEVRKLAEQVTASVGDITSIVNNIQNESNAVVHSLQTGYDQVDEGSKQIKVTGETFENIRGSVSEMATKITVISENLTDISNDSQEMNGSIQEIASVSEESAAGVEQASASAQQSSSSMDEISNNSNDLAQLAEQLNEQVQKFKV
ncbi:methyl-accepting chemotaxis protein [Pontibacillus marinus BH030004 = DSM 16465]|uniref:Methyl-accepting chemotaxis protein n=1 Tax=Pontibacillus marinus BH030004 = DSM 16465 TaxID=1385511 RepID=A0A0A5GI49_9BACI|nr:methyl-accepting chemotaxis protein [Pontibacillus marinus BH030004 = DSM 16465]